MVVTHTEVYFPFLDEATNKWERLRHEPALDAQQ